VSGRDFLLGIVFPDDRAEEVQAVLYLCGSLGEYERGGLLTAFFDSKRAREEASARLEALPGVSLFPSDEVREDWLERYQQSLEPLLVGRRFLVTPDRSLAGAATDRIVLHIPQERAFGTGSHETTALCLEMLEALDLEGRTGVDVGTGSGILAIGMLKLGAARVFAFDDDPEITGVVHRNLRRNSVRRILPFVGSTGCVRRLQADVVTMNIVPEVVIALLPEVRGWIVEEGTVILSGILAARRTEVLEEAAAASLRLAAEATRGEWWCGSLRPGPREGRRGTVLEHQHS
jgi:ribosomal protein L11 methyltransferase